MIRGTLLCLAVGLCAFWPQALVLCCAPDGGCGVRPADQGCDDEAPGGCSDCDDVAPGEAPSPAPSLPAASPPPLAAAPAASVPPPAGPALPAPPPPSGRLRALDGVLLTI